MLNADTDAMYAVPTYGTPFSVEHDLSARAIEEAVTPQKVREGTFDLAYEEAPRPNYWNVDLPAENHETMPQSVVQESGYQRAPDAVAEIDNLSVEASAKYVLTLTHTLMGVRQEARSREDFTLAA